MADLLLRGMADLTGESPEQRVKRIRALRVALGFPIARRFAQEMGVGDSTWNTYETGVTPPPVFPVGVALVRRYGITLDWLYLGVRTAMPYDLVLRIEEAAEQNERAASATLAPR